MRNEPNPTPSREKRSGAASPVALTAAEGVRLGLIGYRLLARRPIPFLRLTGPWVLLGILMGAFGPILVEDLAAAVEWVAWAATSVAWCRLLLLSAECPVGGNLSRRERRYILSALPMVAAGLLVMVALYVVAGAVNASHGATLQDLLRSPRFLWSTAAAGLLAYLISAARFQLMFPAIAIDDRTMTFRASLRLTRGNTVAIFLGSLVACAPQLMPSLAYWLPENQTTGLALAAANGLDYLASMASAAVLSGFCAQLYARQFGTLASVFE